MFVAGDPALPPASTLFPLTYDVRGLRLAIVLGNQATLGLCPFAKAGLCHHCDIGSGEGTQFDAEKNLRRIEWFKNYYASVFPKLSHLVIYNSGSTLNPVELSPEVLESLLKYVRTLPNLKMLSMDSRESFVTPARVMQLASHLGRRRELRIILGVESADDRIRNEILEKRMSKRAIESAVRTIASVREKVNSDRTTNLASLGISINVVIGGPGTTAATAVNDAVGTSVYGVELAEAYRLPIDLNLHPYYPSRRGISRFPDHQRASLTLLRETICAIVERIKNRAVLFIGWQDEGHDQQQEQRRVERAMFTEAFDYFNRTGRVGHIPRAL